MNVMANQMRSDESPLKPTEFSGEFSYQKQQSAEVRTM